MDITSIILIVLVIIFIPWWIFAQFERANETKSNIDYAKKLKTELEPMEEELSQIIFNLSKYVNNCKHCSHNTFSFYNISPEIITYDCCSCSKRFKLKHYNDYLEIKEIPELNELINNKIKNTLDPIMKKSLKYVESMYFTYAYAPEAKPFYDLLFDLKFDHYFPFHIKSRKEYGMQWHYSSIKFTSDGRLMDKHNQELYKKKIDKKINSVREPISRDIVIEWSYLKVTKGEKKDTIKNWAKESELKCPDGSKCGNIMFSKLEAKDIAFGHLIPQDFAKEFPHYKEIIHHPDNLYLTCKSCNSSLGGNPPDTVLRQRILINGTIGDWIREKVIN